MRLGVRRSRYCSGVLLLPVDLVNLKTADIGRLIARWRSSPRHVAARRIADSAGTPLILPRWLYGRAANRTGDEGLREMLRSLPPSLLSRVAMPSAAPDIDTPGDLARARRAHRASMPAPPRAT